MLVADASVITSVVADAGDDGARRRARLRQSVVSVPDLLKVEVTSALRILCRSGRLAADQAAIALEALLELPLASYPSDPLLRRAWELRDNVAPYDGCYVALAEALRCPLLTADRRLARAPGLLCQVELVT